MTQANIILALGPQGQLLCEGPSSNGTRHKVDMRGFTLHDLPAPIVAELLAQRDRLRQQELDREARLVAQARDRQRQVYQTLANIHDLPFARKVMPYMQGTRQDRALTQDRPLVKSKPRAVDPASLGF